MSNVVLNLYDIIDNTVTSFVGLGVHHSGIEVYGSEWSFGFRETSDSGVFAIEPRSAEGVRFRESIILGKTSYSRRDVDRIIADLSSKWPGNTYDLLERNCNCFCDELSRKLCGTGLPGYVNRLARIGSVFRCVLPSKLFGDREPVKVNTESNTVTSGGHTQPAVTSPDTFKGKSRVLGSERSSDAASANGLTTGQYLALAQERMHERQASHEAHVGHVLDPRDEQRRKAAAAALARLQNRTST
jgi:hypothetical protein